MVCPVEFLDKALADDGKYDMAGRLPPLLAALAGCLLGGLASGRPPSRVRARNTWDDGVEEGGRDDEWSEPQPEPAVDPYHQWNDQANMQNLGMGQWAPTWSWSSWSSWDGWSTGEQDRRQWWDGAPSAHRDQQPERATWHDRRPQRGWREYRDDGPGEPRGQDDGGQWGAWEVPQRERQPRGQDDGGQWSAWEVPQRERRREYRDDGPREPRGQDDGGQWGAWEVPQRERQPRGQDDGGQWSAWEVPQRERQPARAPRPDRQPGMEREERRDAGTDEFLYIPGWGRGAPLLPRDRRAAGFYRDGVWVDRPRTDLEERWQRGGGGEVRTQRREDRQRQWFDGTFRPAAFRRATEESGGGLVVNQAMRDHFREILRRADRRDEPAQASPSPPQQQQYGGVGSDGVVHQVLTHTGGGTFSSPWWTAAEWRRWRARRARLAESTVEVGVDWSATGLPMVMDFVAELMGASPGMCSTPGTTTTTSSTCSSFSGTSPNSVPTARGTVTTSMAAVLTSLPSTSTSTFLENGQQGSGQEEEDVMLMQTGARTDAPDREENNRTEENSQVGENMSVGETAEEGGYGDGADGPEEPGEAYGLSADERDELVELGWDEGVVADLHEFLLYLSDVRSRAGAGAVAWALGQWAHSLILAESTLDLATDVLFRRVQGVAEERPEDFGVRGRLCVGFAGFQKALGGMHLRITQRLLQDEWMRTSDVGDPPLLGPAGGVLADNTQTAALALEVARERARNLVDRARRARRARLATAASSSWEGTPEQDAAGHQPEHPGEDADDVEEDSHSLMQLTRDEENDLDNLAVDDEVRRCLRDLLRSLEEQENRDVGAEYRWGVQQVLEACVGAQRVMECVRNILRNRVVPSQAMRSWPCQRIPPFGPLRSRIGAWMAEYRWVVVQAFDRELGASLQELLGCPAASREPVGPATPARRGRATREPRVPPRGSRSRSPVVRSSSMVPGVGTGNVLSSTGVTSVVEGDTGMADEREDIGVRDRPAPDLPGDPGVRAGPGVGSDVPGLPVHAPPCGPIETVPVPPHGGSVGGDDDDGAVTASVARETGPGVAAGMGPGALDLPCLALPGEGVPALLEGPALPEGPGIRPRAPAAEGFDAGALPVPGDGVDVLRTSVLYGGLDASSTPGMGSMTGDGPEPEGSP